MKNEPSILENLPDKVLRIALKIIEPEYKSYDDFEFDVDFTSLCDDVIKMTSLRKGDYGEIEDYSFLYELFRLNEDFESSPNEPLIKPNFNEFTLEFDVEESRRVIEVYQHSSGSYNPDGSDLENIYKSFFGEGYVDIYDGDFVSEDTLDSDYIDSRFVEDSIKKI